MMTEKKLSAYLESYEALARFGERYRADAALRARIDGGDYSGLYGMVPDGVEVRVVSQSPERYYMAMPADPNSAVADWELRSVTGGSACIGSLLTSMCAGSCVSSGGSLGTASCNPIT